MIISFTIKQEVKQIRKFSKSLYIWSREVNQKFTKQNFCRKRKKFKGKRKKRQKMWPGFLVGCVNSCKLDKWWRDGFWLGQVCSSKASLFRGHFLYCWFPFTSTFWLWQHPFCTITLAGSLNVRLNKYFLPNFSLHYQR